MESLLVALPGLGCAVMMGAMVWLMSRGDTRHDGTTPPGTSTSAGQESQLSELRAELERLRAEIRSRDQESDRTRDDGSGDRPSPTTST